MRCFCLLLSLCLFSENAFAKDTPGDPYRDEAGEDGDGQVEVEFADEAEARVIRRIAAALMAENRNSEEERARRAARQQELFDAMIAENPDGDRDVLWREAGQQALIEEIEAVEVSSSDDGEEVPIDDPSHPAYAEMRRQLIAMGLDPDEIDLTPGFGDEGHQ